MLSGGKRVASAALDSPLLAGASAASVASQKSNGVSGTSSNSNDPGLLMYIFMSNEAMQEGAQTL